LVTVIVVGALALAATGLTAMTTVAPAVRPSPPELAAARTALVQYLRDNSAPVQLARPATGNTAISYNWSGYVDKSSTRGTFTSVAGTWTTPSVTCTSEDTITSEWVGIDGWSDKTVEQAGTLDWCFEGVPTYFTWYDMASVGTVEVGTSLQPGDVITASVSHSGNGYALFLTDTTNPANNFTKTAKCAATKCLDTSAEWIAERPTFATTGYAPLADFSTWNLIAGTVIAGSTSGTISSFSPYQVDMVDSTDRYNLATPSSLTGGKSFTVTWDNSY